MCSIRSITSHLQLPNPNVLRKETSKDVACYCQEGWPPYDKKLSCEEQATCENGCLQYGSHVVITLRKETLKLLYLGHFGIERMKQLARTAVYWPGIDKDIYDLCKSNCVIHVMNNRTTYQKLLCTHAYFQKYHRIQSPSITQSTLWFQIGYHGSCIF